MQKSGADKIYIIYFFNLFVSMFPLWLSILIKYFFKLYIFIKPSTIRDASLIKIFSSHQFLFSFSIILVYIISRFCLIKYLDEFNPLMEDSKRFKKVTRYRTLTLSFVITYVLPLLAFNFMEMEGIILFVVYFSTISLLVVKNRVFDGNMVLEFHGYNFYNCIDCSNNNEYIIISKFNIEINKEYPIKFINQNDVGIIKV